MGLLDGKLGGVTNLINLFGGTVVLRRLSEGTYNTATQSYTPTETSGVSPCTTKGVWSSYLTGIARFDLGGDGVVKPGDRALLIENNSTLTFAPRGGDIVEFSGVQYTVMNVDPISTGGAIAAYQLQVRQ